MLLRHHGSASSAAIVSSLSLSCTDVPVDSAPILEMMIHGSGPDQIESGVCVLVWSITWEGRGSCLGITLSTNYRSKSWSIQTQVGEEVEAGCLDLGARKTTADHNSCWSARSPPCVIPSCCRTCGQDVSKANQKLICRRWQLCFLYHSALLRPVQWRTHRRVCRENVVTVLLNHVWCMNSDVCWNWNTRECASRAAVQLKLWVPTLGMVYYSISASSLCVTWLSLIVPVF